MIGQLQWHDLGYFRVEGDKKVHDGLSFFQVQLANKERLLPYRVRRGGKLLQEERIRQLLAPMDFPHWQLLQGMGLRPYDPLPTLQSLGDVLLLRLLEKTGQNPATATVVLCGDRVTPSFQGVALALCPFVRELLILAPQGGEALQQRLYRDYGMAPTSLQGAYSAVVSFAVLPQDKRQRILQLGEVSSTDFCGLQLKKRQIPEGFSPQAWISLLLQHGKITKAEIEIS